MSAGAEAVEDEEEGHPTPPAPAAADLRATGDRIETLLASFAASGRPVQERAEDLVRLVAGLYGAGLERLLEIVDDTGLLSARLLDRLAEDELVASLLLVHGLHPYDVETRVLRALDGLRPDLAAQGVDVELGGIEPDGTVRLLMAGAKGCGAATVVESVTAVVEAVAPDAPAVVTEQAAAPAAQTLIPIDSLSVRTRAAPGPHQ